MRFKLALLTMVISLALVAIAPGGAFAKKTKATPTPVSATPVATAPAKAKKGDAVKGKITAFTSSSLTIQDKDKNSVTVALVAKTKFFVDGKKVDTAPTFTNGEVVAVQTRTAADGSLIAVAVHVTTKAAPAKTQDITGTVTAATGTSITIQLKDGSTFTVNLSDKTKYAVGGKPSDTNPGFKAGDVVRIAARAGADGSLTAVRVAVARAKPAKTPKAQRILASVSGSTSSSLTLQSAGKDPVTVSFNGNTKFYVDGKLVTAPPAFKTGDQVLVLAQKQADGSVTALAVYSGKIPKGAGKVGPGATQHFVGTLQSSTATSLTIAGKGKNAQTVTVQITNQTRFLINGKLGTTPPAFTNGMTISVLASTAPDGSLVAVLVGVTTKP